MTSLALLEPPAEAADDFGACVALAAGRLNRAHADLVALTVRLLDGDRWAGGGVVSAEHWLVLRVGLSPSRARDVVLLARRRAELVATGQALDDGALSLDQAVVVARHVPAHHERAAAELAVFATVPQLRRSLSRYRFSEPPAEPADTTDDAADGSADAAADTAMNDRDGDRDGDAPVADRGIPTDEETVSPEDGTLAGDEAKQTGEDDVHLGEADPTVDPQAPGGDPCDVPVTGSAAWAAAEASLSMYHADGRFHLRYDAPSDVGALVEQALLEAKDALFRLATGRPVDADEEPGARGPGDDAASGPVEGPGTGGPVARVTMAEALAELARRSLGACSPRSRQEHYRVYVHLSTDGAWVNGRGAIPPSLAARFACEGTAQAVIERDGVPVSVGRALRIVPDRTRRLVEDRDRGCRYPGCPTTRHLEVHHLDHWADGGRTDLDRLVCLCPRHHDAHHREEFTMTGDPTTTLGAAGSATGLRFLDAHGHHLGPVVPRRDAPDRDGAPYAGPTGEDLHLRLVELPTNAQLAEAEARWRRARGRDPDEDRGDPPGGAGSGAQAQGSDSTTPPRMTSVLDLIADGRW